MLFNKNNLRLREEGRYLQRDEFRIFTVLCTVRVGRKGKKESKYCNWDKHARVIGKYCTVSHVLFCVTQVGMEHSITVKQNGIQNSQMAEDKL